VDRDRPGWKDSKMIVAWLLFAAGAVFVLWMGSPDFSAPMSSRYLRPILEFLFPGITPRQLVRAHFYVRKGAHLLEYAGLALLAFRALRLSLDTLPGRIAFGAIILTLLVAATDETRQAFTHTRTGSPADVALDTAGALLAVGLAVVVLRRRDRREPQAGAVAP
jgi:VanZ family protein